MELRDRWSCLCARLGTTEAADTSFDALCRSYSTPPRAYHNLDHVAHCLEELEEVRHLAHSPDAVESAIWFHDAIYDPRAKDNELRSAHLAQATLRGMGVAVSLCETTQDLILVTKHDTPPVTTDQRIVVDVDLSILGQTRERFDAYERQIRQEYDWVPEAQYRDGRARVLRSFLSRARIFHLTPFADRYEALARENLRRSLALLEG